MISASLKQKGCERNSRIWRAPAVGISPFQLSLTTDCAISMALFRSSRALAISASTQRPYTYHHLPSGARDVDSRLLLGPGMTIRLKGLFDEICECDIGPDRLFIDPQAAQPKRQMARLAGYRRPLRRFMADLGLPAGRLCGSPWRS